MAIIGILRSRRFNLLLTFVCVFTKSKINVIPNDIGKIMILKKLMIGVFTWSNNL